MAIETRAYIVGGSIPEREPSSGNIYSTCLIFGRNGQLLASHRKIHLFDIDMPGRMTFRESETLSPGTDITIVNLEEYGTIAIGICYDMRFPELATIGARNGAFALIYPSAFNMNTGPLHWELLGRSRAVDNQVFVVLCSQARDYEAEYRAWGHSVVVDPRGTIVTGAEEKETIVYADLDVDTIQQARSEIPVTTQRRFDVYPDISNCMQR